MFLVRRLRLPPWRARIRQILHKGRGATFNPKVRFESAEVDPFDDGWGSLAQAREDDPPPRTEVTPDASRSVIARNTSPDIAFDRSINPYRGCEHGCVYCYARPTHAYLGLSPGLDFETKLLAKFDAATLLERELGRPGYDCQPIALGTNTDPYQPSSDGSRSRGACSRCSRAVGIRSRSSPSRPPWCAISICSAPMARQNLARVAISVTTLDGGARAPARAARCRAASPPAGDPAAQRGGRADRGHGRADHPALTDHEIERILEAAAAAGASSAGYVLLRLPHEVKELFEGWLEAHAPERARHVLSLVRQCRGGRLYDATFGRRMRGEGAVCAS